MARRQGRKVLPFSGGQQASRRPITTRKLSDHERLLLEKGLAACDAVLAQTQTAADQLVRAVMVTAQVDPEEGWMFNRQKMQWEKHPVPKNA